MFPAGTRVCLYLRRSDAKQDESLDVQRSSATRYCDERGWIVATEFVDDAISRAEFVRRKGLIAMLADAEASSPAKRRGKRERAWNVVVCRDSSRLGGDMLRTTRLMQDLRDAECSVVYYISDELVQIDTTTDRLLMTVRTFADELEREKTACRTSEGLNERVRDGRAAGGPCYGYRIVDKKYAPDDDQAAVVRRIFADYENGIGQRLIATRLNNDRVPAPTNAGKRAIGLWSRPTVRRILLNERYRGIATHGKEQKVYRGGTRIRVARPAAQVLTYETPAIVSAHQWDAVQARLAANPRFAHCTATRGAPSRYFLVSRARCAACGGSVFGLARGPKRPPVYVCGRRRSNGTAICSNAMAHRVAETDAAVVAEIARLLVPAVMDEAIAVARRRLVEALRVEPDERNQIEGEIRSVKSKLRRLAAAIDATEDEAGALTETYRQRQAQLKALESRLASTSTAARAVAELDDLAALARSAGDKLRAAPTLDELRALFAPASSEPLRMDAAGIVGSVEIATLLGGSLCVTPRSGNNTEQHASAAVLVPFRVRLATAA